MSNCRSLSRRQLLARMGGLAAVLAGSALVSACGATSTPTPSPAPKPMAPSPTSTSAPKAVAPTSTPAPTRPAQVTPVPAPKEKVKPTFWFWGGPAEKETNEKIVAKYNAESTTAEIQPVNVARADYVTKFETAVAGGQAPDCGYVTQEQYFRWACSGLLADLLPILEAQKINPKTKWHPQAQWWYGAKYFATSIALNPQVLFYNMDLFKAAGVPEPPFTAQTAWKWADFVDAARKLTTDANGKHPNEPGFDRSKVQIWGVLPRTDHFGYMPYFFQTDAQPFGAKFEKANVTSDAVVGPLQALADLMVKENVAPLAADMAGAAGNALFLAGKIAMFLSGAWELQALTAKPPSFDLRVGVLPIYGSKYQTLTLGGPASVMAKSKYQEEALKFILYYINHDNSIINLQTGLWCPHTEEFLTGPKRKLWLDDYPQHHPPHFVEAVLGTMDLAKTPDFKKFGGYDETWNQIVKAALEPCWTGKSTVKDAMAAATSKIDEMLQREGKSCPPILDA